MKPTLKVVDTELKGEAAAIRDLRHGYKSISDLEKRYGVSRQRLRDLQAQYDPKREKRLKGLNRPKTEAQPKPEPEKPKPIHSRHWGLAGFALLMSIGLGLDGMVLNGAYAWSLSQDWLDKLIFVSIGVFIDGVAVIGLATFIALLTWRLWPLAVFLVLPLWVACSVASVLVSLSFSATNIGDKTKHRANEVRDGAVIESRLAQLRSDRSKITESQSVAEIDADLRQAKTSQYWRSSNECQKPTIPESIALCAQITNLDKIRARTVQRDDIEAQIATAEKEQRSLPAVASADPGADRAASMSWGWIRPSDATNYKTTMYALMPAFSGILLAVAKALIRVA